MSLETDLTALLQTQCPRVFPDFAPVTTARPYVTYQHIGGRTIDFLDNTVGNKRHTRVQVNVWTNSRLEALALIRSIEAAMRASAAFIATPDSEPISDFDADVPVYGSIQDFSIYSTR